MTNPGTGTAQATIRFGGLDAVRHVLGRLRAADLREVCYQRGIEPDQFDAAAYAQEMIARADLLRVVHAPDHEPVAVLGTVRDRMAGPGAHVVGMLATERWAAVARPFTRWCLAELEPAMHRLGATVLRCQVWIGHRVSIGWIERLGAALESAGPLPPSGQTFRTYAWRAAPDGLTPRAARLANRAPHDRGLAGGTIMGVA